MELPQTVFNKLVKQEDLPSPVYDDGVRVGFAGLHYARSLLKEEYLSRRKGCYCLTDLGLYISNMKCRSQLQFKHR